MRCEFIKVCLHAKEFVGKVCLFKAELCRTRDGFLLHPPISEMLKQMEEFERFLRNERKRVSSLENRDGDLVIVDGIDRIRVCKDGQILVTTSYLKDIYRSLVARFIQDC